MAGDNRNLTNEEAKELIAQLEYRYPEEFKKVHWLQYQDMKVHGKVRPETQKQMDAIMDAMFKKYEQGEV